MNKQKQEEFDKFINEQYAKFGEEVAITCMNKAKLVLQRCFNKYWELNKGEGES
jgi:hypothetical protein